MTTWIALIQVGILMAVAPSHDVTTLDGQTHNGVITRIDSHGVTLHADARDAASADNNAANADGRMIATEQLAQVTLSGDLPVEKVDPFVATGCIVDLVDGSSLNVKRVTGDDSQLTLEMPDGRTISVARDRVAAIRMQSGSESIDTEWQRVLGKAMVGDLVVLRKGDVIDYLDGVIHQVGDDTVQFELDGDTLPVPRGRLQGVILHRRGDLTLDDPICSLTDRSGSRWQVATIEMGTTSDSEDASAEESVGTTDAADTNASDENTADANTTDASTAVRIVTSGGIKTHLPLDQIVQLDFSQGKIVYLGDLEPESIRWTPLLKLPGFDTKDGRSPVEQFFAYRVDRSLLGGPLRLTGDEFDRGVAVHSRSEITYRLPDDYRRLRAIVGIDDRVRPRGNVQLTVQGDDRVLLEETISGTAEPLSLDLDMTGVRRLIIKVDYGEGGDLADHLDLARARLVK